MTVHNHESLKSLLFAWGHRTLISLDAHYDAARHFSRKNYWIGIPATVLAAIVGTSVFATLEQDVDTQIKIVVGMTSVVAAVLSTLQTLLKYSERATKHRHTAARYSAVKREIEQLLTLPEGKLSGEQKTVDLVRQKIDELGVEAPELPERFLKASRKKYPLDKAQS